MIAGVGDQVGLRGFVDTRHRKRLLRSALVLGDGVSLTCATLLATRLRFGRSAVFGGFEVAQSPITYAEVGWVFVALGLVFLLREGLYDLDSLFWGSAEFSRVIRALVNTTVAFLIASYALKMPGLSRAWMLLALSLSAIFILGDRLFMRFVLRAVRRSGWLGRRTLVVGCDAEADSTARFLLAHPETGLIPVGYVATAEDVHAPALANLLNLGGEEELPSIVRRHEIDTVIIASSAYENRVAQRLVALLRGFDISIYLTSVYKEILAQRVSLCDIASAQFVRIRPISLSAPKLAAKRTIDLLVAVAGIVVGLPLWFAIALAIKIDSRGPVFFRQERVRQGGAHFRMLKFRSMQNDAEEALSYLRDRNESTGPLFKMRNDPRVTRTGKWMRRYSIDELPQLINVLLGDMSLVGPRPPLPDEVERYTEKEWRRLDVRPGMTGLWQVSGRSDIGFDEMVWLDLYYIENWSVGFDASLIVRTVGAVLRARGAW
ncbi:MAG: sugar transferase [Coriobacteriia bacterium]